MSTKTQVFAGGAVDFKAAPIPPEWIVSGEPVAQNHVMFVSDDRSSMTLFWRCTAGTFRWIYDEEETIYVLDGGMTLTFPDGTVRRVEAGDVVHFAAGSTALWEVESHVHKIAVFRRPIPAALGGLLHAYRRGAALVADRAGALMPASRQAARVRSPAGVG